MEASCFVDAGGLIAKVTLVCISDQDGRNADDPWPRSVPYPDGVAGCATWTNETDSQPRRFAPSRQHALGNGHPGTGKLLLISEIFWKKEGDLKLA